MLKLHLKIDSIDKVSSVKIFDDNGNYRLFRAYNKNPHEAGTVHPEYADREQCKKMAEVSAETSAILAVEEQKARWQEKYEKENHQYNDKTYKTLNQFVNAHVWRDDLNLDK